MKRAIVADDCHLHFADERENLQYLVHSHPTLICQDFLKNQYSEVDLVGKQAECSWINLAQQLDDQERDLHWLD
jgi:hypothetical protein